jgi:hypothetical protein
MIAVKKAAFADPDTASWKGSRSGSVALWPGGFDAFVIAITCCRPFCDGRHIPPIASVLIFSQVAVRVIRQSRSRP